MKPICVKCQRFYRILQNGVRFLEQMPDGNDAKPGMEQPERWSPYKIWFGDLWECPDCNSHIIVGTGAHPLAEHFQYPKFDKELELAGPAIIKINDC